MPGICESMPFGGCGRGSVDVALAFEDRRQDTRRDQDFLAAKDQPHRFLLALRVFSKKTMASQFLHAVPLPSSI